MDLEPALPESLEGDRLWAGGSERLGEGKIIPSEAVLEWAREEWLEGRVLYERFVVGIGVRDLPFFRLPTMWVARFEPETGNWKKI